MPKTKTAKAKQPKITEEAPKDEDLEQGLKDFKASWDYAAGSLHERWSNSYKLYNNERVKRGYEGISDTFIPMTFSTVETLTSALFGSKPKFNFLAPSTKPDQKTDILNAVVDYYWERDQWSMKVINTGRGFIREGTGIDYFCWEGDHPVMINVANRDFIIDPTSIGENARYMGRRYLTTKEELESYEVVDLEKPIETPIFDEMGMPTGKTDTTYDMRKKYTKLDQLESSFSTNKQAQGVGTEKTDKQEKDFFFGSTLNDTDDLIEVIELWYEDKTISIANRKVVIENTENYFKAKGKANGDEYAKGLMPFAWARNYTDASLFWAKGDVDFIADQQEDLNDTTNQNKDAITYTNNQMYTVDPKYADLAPEIENLPGAVYVAEKDAIMPIQRGTIPPDAFNERMNIKSEIRETTASNEVVKGVGESAGAKSTATEINAQIAGAGQRINLKITQIENEYFHRMARIVFAMIRLYVTEPMMVRIVGKDGASWEEFDPKEFSDGNYEPRVQLDIAVENKKLEEAAKAKEMLAAFLNDPDVNQSELKKVVLAKGFDLEPDEVEALMTPMPGAVDPMTGMPLDPAMMGGAMPGAVPTPSPGLMSPDQMHPEDRAILADHLDPSTASDIPGDVALRLPEDATPEELEMIRASLPQ